MAAGLQRLGKLTPEATAVFVCDIQERFRPLIYKMPYIIQSTKNMIECAKVMNLPVIITEQYPKALGKTVSELDISSHFLVEKTLFSMMTPEIENKLKSLPNIHSVLIAGLETHVCVFQTTLDLLEKGYDVHVLADCVSSQDKGDRKIAVERLRQAGAFVTTSESAIFLMMKSTSYPHFRTISGLIKGNKAALESISNKTNKI